MDYLYECDSEAFFLLIREITSSSNIDRTAVKMKLSLLIGVHMEPADISGSYYRAR